MPPSDQEKIGLFIKKLRDEKGITQADFAKRLKTSQSAVARIESGNQNVTIEQLMKIGEVLNHNIVSLQNTIDFKVKGGKKLHGAIVTNTSKNGAI